MSQNGSNNNQSDGRVCPGCGREFSSNQAVSIHQANGCYPELGDREWVKEAYICKKMSIREIADEVGCSRHPVQEAIDRFGIEPRDTSDATRLSTTPDKLLDGEWLREHYIDKEWSGMKIARELDCHNQSVYDALRYYNIPIRSYSEAHPGEPVEEYGAGWDESKREQVRERDEYECQVCGMLNEEHIERVGNSLHVHHIRKARKFDDPKQRNSPNNLITLCVYCHRQADRYSPLLPAPSN